MISYLVGLLIWLLPLILYWVFLRDSDSTKNLLWLVVVFLFSWIGLIACFVVKKVLK